MLKKFIKKLVMLLVLVTFSAGNVYAAECKGKSKSSCSSNNSCSWVSGYSKKDGGKVKSYCRSKSKSGDAGSNKNKVKKTKKEKSKKDIKKKSKKLKDKSSKDKKNKSKKLKDKKSK